MWGGCGMVSAHVPPIYTWICLDFKIFILKKMLILLKKI